jgi:hypothetical protein
VPLNLKPWPMLGADPSELSSHSPCGHSVDKQQIKPFSFSVSLGSGS